MWLFCYYDKLFPDYSKALIYFDKLIDTNVEDDLLTKAKEYRAEVRANLDKYNEQILLERANQILTTNEPDSWGILYYIKCLILFNNPKCERIYYIFAQFFKSKVFTAAERNIKQLITINPNEQKYYDLFFSIISHFVFKGYGKKTFKKNIKKYYKIIMELTNKYPNIKLTVEAYCIFYYYYKLSKDNKSAMEVIDKAIELNSNDVFMFEDRARLKYENGDIDGAIKDYEKIINLLDSAVELDPNYTERNLYKGIILQLQQKYKKAIEYYKKAEKNGDIFVSIGYCYSMIQEPLNAVKYYNKAIKYNKYNNFDTWIPYRNKIGELICLEKYKLAIILANRIEKLYNKELDKGFYGNKGLAYYYLKDYKNAIKYLRKNPECDISQPLIAYITFLEGNIKLALKKLENIIPNTPDAEYSKFFYISLIYYNNKEYDNALKFINKIEEGKSYSYYYLKSMIYKKLNNNVKSEENLNNAKSALNKGETIDDLQRIFEKAHHIKIDK